MSDASGITDVTIIGGGPTGLFAAFYAGLRGVSCRIVDALPQLGGQLMALYPEKYVFDVGGLPRILAKDLAKNMIEQGTQFGPEVVLGEEVQRLEPDGDHIRLVTQKGEYLTKTVVITAGKGALNPRVLECPGWNEHAGDGGGVHTHVRQPEDFRGKRVLLVGGGDSAVDWVLGLKGVASEVTLIHRRPEFRAHKASVEQMWKAAEAGEVAVKTPYEVRSIHGRAGCVAKATIYNNDTNEDVEMEVDAVVALLGFKPDLGPIGNWGLELEKNTIKVSQLMETNLPGVYAAGDVVHYPGKLELIATGYGEAAIAVNNAVHHINPKARVNPGHSTNLKIFKQDD
ncbi:NAD(P)/FAD-dependent oxidoreductase [Longimicrobium sp.]|uniref:NAD(P)/FAD-dependent oxidoreductase n=1 Tax=Longimicrobium sp. TaxID=2029185 RepID=UPI002B5EDC03|nr:NAD(P)/FAD-dependent oxidoreductase [Longimicrobium sp.]HSU17678.1 NAD(P)/FAD-dependent oxidoreductase [Longimicrobium sp.]